MSAPLEIHAYLAGPDVFEPNAIQIGEDMKSLLLHHGIYGHFPYDNEMDLSKFVDPQDAAREIARLNEEMMLACAEEGRIAVIFVNMKPFHGGPSMDVGTAFETGFMSALSRFKNVLIVGYTDEPRLFTQRIVEDVYKGDVICKGTDLVGSDGKLIEEFNGVDNLMITAAIERTGGKILKTFAQAAEYAKQVVTQKAAALNASVAWAPSPL